MKQDQILNAALTSITLRCRLAIWQMDIIPENLEYFCDDADDALRYANGPTALSEAFVKVETRHLRARHSAVCRLLKFRLGRSFTYRGVSVKAHQLVPQRIPAR